MIAERIVRGWYQGAAWLNLLRPLAWLFECVVRRRRARYLADKDQLWRPAAPIIVVGNVTVGGTRSEEHTSELQSRENLVCRLLLEKKKVSTIDRNPVH